MDNLNCIKCGKPKSFFQQDSRGCETINPNPHSPEDNAIFLCSECISKFQYVEDISDNCKIEKNVWRTLADLKYLLDKADKLDSPINDYN